MKPISFDYCAPQTLEEALDALASAPGASVLAGGQSLMPMLNMRVARPALLVDINRIASLSRLESAADCLTVGALARHADVLADAEIRRGWPLLAEATSMIGHPAIRNRGTVCGSVAHADPAAEHPGVLLAMDATVVIASASRRRELPAREFFLGMLTTALERGEMIVELQYPRFPAGTGTAYVEVTRRHGAFAVAGVAAALTLREGVCQAARIGIVGVNDSAFRAEAAEAALKGKHLGSADGARAFAAAAREVASAVNPIDDVHGSASYRRHLAGVLTERSLEKALTRAGGGQVV